MKAPEKMANLVAETRCTLGEGPVWDPIRQQLFWVDIEEGAVMMLNPSSGSLTTTELGEMIGALALAQSGLLLLALESGMALYDLSSKKILRLPILENPNSRMRYNDGKVDPQGNFWIGSMHKGFEKESGTLYRVRPNGQVDPMVPNTTISNGMAWNDTGSTFYFIDSPTYRVFSFHSDQTGQMLTERKECIHIPETMGIPDGMCMDAEGMLWIAHWGGGQVSRWNPRKGQLLEKIHVPAQQVTSCCFGGKDLNVLYMTTARGGLTKEQLRSSPLSGGLFSYIPGVSGKKANYFDDSQLNLPDPWNTTD